MIKKFFNFKGGLHLAGHKQTTTQHPVTPAKLPSIIILPLHQHIGAPAEPIVSVGEHVLKGQKIAKATDYVSAPIHASTSGYIRHIGPHAVPHPSGLPATCMTLEPDGEDKWTDLQNHAHDYTNIDPSALRNLIRDAGIVGLGGAGFPSFIKLNPGPGRTIDTLILNGAECEPYITCDDMLMRERADEIVAGLMILRYALQASHCVIAIEDNKPQAISAVEQAINKLNAPDTQLAIVPTRYPAGGEKQLVYTITGREVPKDGLPIHVGVICQNVGTTAAIYRAINHGEPLISRYMTIAGDVDKPCNLDVLLGTPVTELIAQCQGNIKTLDRIIMGGPMMGFALPNIASPVIKTTNCVTVANKNSHQFSHKKPMMPCIRCGSCADVCPVNLLPQQLYWHASAKELDKTQAFNLFDCIECGCCDYVCPSHIPLVQYYRYAKAEIWQREKETQKSNIARERFEFREKRLAREKAERDARLKKKKEALKIAENTRQEDSKPTVDLKQADILAALERTKTKQATQKVQPKNIDNLTDEQKQMIAEIDARRTQQRQQPTVASKTANTPNDAARRETHSE